MYKPGIKNGYIPQSFPIVVQKLNFSLNLEIMVRID